MTFWIQVNRNLCLVHIFGCGLSSFRENSSRYSHGDYPLPGKCNFVTCQILAFRFWIYIFVFMVLRFANHLFPLKYLLLSSKRLKKLGWWLISDFNQPEVYSEKKSYHRKANTGFNWITVPISPRNIWRELWTLLQLKSS